MLASPPPLPTESKIDLNEITGAIATEQLGQLMELKRGFSNWPKYVTATLMLIGLVVGAAIWATNSHAEIKEWTVGQDFVTKQELREVMKEQYVPLHEFTRVQQSLDDHKKELEKIEIKLDKVLDQLHDQKSGTYHRRR